MKDDNLFKSFTEDVLAFIGFAGLVTAPVWIPYWIQKLIAIGVIS